MVEKNSKSGKRKLTLFVDGVEKNSKSGKRKLTLFVDGDLLDLYRSIYPDRSLSEELEFILYRLTKIVN